MEEIIWVRRFFARWPDEVPRHLIDTPFHRVLRTVDATTLLPNRARIDEVQVSDAENRALVDVWKSWCEFIDGDKRAGWRQLKGTGKRLFYRPEPFILIGCAALLEENRALALRALRKALKNEPRYEVAGWLLDHFGARRAPVLPFLDRSNPLNKYLGMLRHRLFNKSAA